ncbi:MAG: hypothetical protein STSR0004_16220 [Peptococcaceae bacterium]
MQREKEQARQERITEIRRIMELSDGDKIKVADRIEIWYGGTFVNENVVYTGGRTESAVKAGVMRKRRPYSKGKEAQWASATAIYNGRGYGLKLDN